MTIRSLHHVQVNVPLVAESQEAGYETEPAIPIEGRARFFTRDPGGNRLEFLSLETG